MKKKNNQVFSKKNHLLVLLVLFILIVVGFYIRQKQSYSNDTKYNPSNVDIIVVDSDESMSQNQSGENSQGDEVDKQLGPASVKEIIGGTSSDEFYQTPSIEKMLEGEEIEVGQ